MADRTPAHPTILPKPPTGAHLVPSCVPSGSPPSLPRREHRLYNAIYRNSSHTNDHSYEGIPPATVHAMGRRDRDRIRTWAEGLVSEHGSAVARLIGVDPPLPPVTIEVAPDGPPGVTGGLTITLSERWFREHPDDAGCVLHELTHAYMRAPDYDASTIWLIEGIADHVRDVLGFDTSWTFAYFEPGKATAGYQTTADPCSLTTRSAHVRIRSRSRRPIGPHGSRWSAFVRAVVRT